jgi:hypothetical protein
VSVGLYALAIAVSPWSAPLAAVLHVVLAAMWLAPDRTAPHAS